MYTHTHTNMLVILWMLIYDTYCSPPQPLTHVPYKVKYNGISECVHETGSCCLGLVLSQVPRPPDSMSQLVVSLTYQPCPNTNIRKIDHWSNINIYPQLLSDQRKLAIIPEYTRPSLSPTPQLWEKLLESMLAISLSKSSMVRSSQPSLGHLRCNKLYFNQKFFFPNHHSVLNKETK